MSPSSFPPCAPVCDEFHPCEGLGRYATFKNFGMAFLLLFRVSTGDNWNGIMKVKSKTSVPHPEALDAVAGRSYLYNVYVHIHSAGTQRADLVVMCWYLTTGDSLQYFLYISANQCCPSLLFIFQWLILLHPGPNNSW